ncbi:MAG: sulfotransferase family 2 domain-containing protein [Bermanella sp.]
MPIAHPVPLIDPIRKYVLFTNGKCGGTTIKSWFLSNIDFYQAVSNPFYSAKRFGLLFAIGGYLKYFNSRLQVKEMTNADLRDSINFYRSAYSKRNAKARYSLDYKKIIITRDPFKRVVSGFVDKFCGEDRNEAWVAGVVESHGNNGDFSFSDFVNYLCNVKEELHDPHWRRQTFIIDGVDVDYFLKLENIEEDFRSVSHVVGEEFSDYFAVKRQGNIYKDDASWKSNEVPYLSQNEIMSLAEKAGSFPGHSCFLNEELKVKIRKVYEKDFTRFTYYDK